MTTQASSRPRTLFVDDDQLLLAALARGARRFGFDVVTSSEPVDALRLVQEAEFAAVVSDYAMPLMDGLTFLGEVRAVSPGCVRFLLTGHGSFELGMRAVESRAVDRLLSKPCAASELLLALRQAIEHKQLVDRASQLTELCRSRMATSSALSAVDRDASGAIVIGSAADEMRLLAELEELIRSNVAPAPEGESA